MGLFSRKAVTETQVLDALRAVQDPDLHRDIVTLGFVRHLKVQGASVSFDINLTTPACPVREEMRGQAQALVKALEGVEDVAVNMTAEVARSAQPRGENLEQVRNLVAVGSGKGGVGKSTLTVNLAVALARVGARVGLLDADIYGPTVPILLGRAGATPETRGDRLVPVESHGVRFMSMGFFAPGDKPLIWRGPMAHGALQQCLFQVEWGELDYLLVDLPPGTGDVHLTMAQSAPLTGAVIISTPQDVGLTISRKTLRMFEQTRVHILGMVENMSGWVCAHCGERDDIFGRGTLEGDAARLGIPFLGAVPLDRRIRDGSDAGQPVVASRPDSPGALAYVGISRRLAAEVSKRNLAAAGLPTGADVPRELVAEAGPSFTLVWGDGHRSSYPAASLRRACPCATCVDETTGRPLLDPATVPEDLWITWTRRVGQYGVSFKWTDGHETGIFRWDGLRRMCPCEACRGPDTSG